MDASGHPKRTLLYVRQSSLKQVIHNTESAIRQYDLRGKAIALGWAADQITVIDIDQGHSGASAADREGFQHLVAEVSLGRAGIVLGLECSRLARNSADWHQLLGLCGMTGTLICDEDGLYDPPNFNDRLLLGSRAPSRRAYADIGISLSTGYSLNRSNAGQRPARVIRANGLFRSVTSSNVGRRGGALRLSEYPEASYADIAVMPTSRREHPAGRDDGQERSA